ncbi:hypothetical protein [Paraburkholderia hospita]|nr:hypothetical protein [Paraburkholderia hospita]
MALTENLVRDMQSETQIGVIVRIVQILAVFTKNSQKINGLHES